MTSDEGQGLYPVGSGWLDRLFYGGILLWTVILLFNARDWASREDWLLPVISGALLIGLVLGRAGLRQWRDQHTQEDDYETETSELVAEFGETESMSETRSLREQHVAELTAIASVLSVTVAIYLFGFALVLPVFVFIYVWMFTHDLTYAIISTVVTLLFLAFVLLVFDVVLWEGIFDIPLPLI